MIFFTYVLTKYFNAFRTSGKRGQVQRRGPEIVGFRQVGSRVQQQPYQFRVTFVRGPVQCRVTINVGQVVKSTHAQQKTSRGSFSKHARSHQRCEAFEIRYVWVHSGLRNIK